jgi:precorrin-2 dehydrogenase/sirohydrochlorin ferrochelatase
MHTIAANLDLRGRAALLVGAGAVGRRKLSYLLKSGAAITAVEPRPAPWLLELAAEGRLTILPEFSPELLDPSPIVFLAADPKAAQAILPLIRERGLWVNAAGDPALGNFTLPALAEDGPFRLAVSTGGSSPAFAALAARRLRREWAGSGAFCQALGALRAVVLASSLPPAGRRGVLQRLAESAELRELMASGRAREAEELSSRLVSPLTLPAGFSLDFHQS